MDKVFKALADDTRRRLLDRLHERAGQTLGQLCEHIDMTRQSVTQHLAVLEAAHLVATVRRGREKLHYLNPVPLHDIQERWIDKFERPRLRVLTEVKRRAEEAAAGRAMAGNPAFVYVTYIAGTPERVWDALTDADLTAAYWGHANVSDWRPGSRWEHVRTDGSGTADVVGTVVASERPTRLVTTWAAPDDESRPERHSRVTFEIRSHPGADTVRLTVTHENLADEGEFADISQAWPAVLSGLKSLLETGRALPREARPAPSD
ncbi:ArsR/SmtB family transcription factor [Streptomyces sp. NPDC006259]|uniref:ArsR/SmtB family transcription factor n=1 Tax=Streptomyces sp. NPDC006259 TaxID=3364740 RepID=UPI0036C81C06